MNQVKTWKIGHINDAERMTIPFLWKNKEKNTNKPAEYVDQFKHTNGTRKNDTALYIYISHPVESHLT